MMMMMIHETCIYVYIPHVYNTCVYNVHDVTKRVCARKEHGYSYKGDWSCIISSIVSTLMINKRKKKNVLVDIPSMYDILT